MDLLRLDREIEAAVTALARWRARIHAGEAAAWDEAPLESRREVQGKRLRDALAALPPSPVEGPLRDALVAWVEALTVARVARDAEVDLSRAEHEPRGTLTLERATKVSLHDAVRGLVASTSAEEARRHVAAIDECAPLVLEARRRVRDLEREVLSRLEVADADGPPALVATARAFLDHTRDLARDELKRRPAPTWPLALDVTLARSAAEGWPNRLGPRFVLDALRGWTQGVRLPAFTVPSAHGGASFAIAFARFGVALRHAFSPRGIPFALRVPPRFVDAERFGLLFASLLATRRFSTRRLGLSQRVAAAQSRAFAAAFLVEGRRLAAKLCVLAGAPKDELAHEVLGEADRASSLFFDLAPGDVGRALALFGVAPLARELRDRHDDDWFDNPRAIVELRSRSAAPAPEIAPSGDAAVELARAFEVELR